MNVRSLGEVGESRLSIELGPARASSSAPENDTMPSSGSQIAANVKAENSGTTSDQRWSSSFLISWENARVERFGRAA